MSILIDGVAIPAVRVVRVVRVALVDGFPLPKKQLQLDSVACTDLCESGFDWKIIHIPSSCCDTETFPRFKNLTRV